MAVTSIWAVRRSIKDLINYASNPEKTANPNLEDLKQLVNYLCFSSFLLILG